MANKSIGIDVSKATLDIAILQKDSSNIKSYKKENSKEGIEKISKIFKKEKVCKKAPIVIESTGTYHLLVCFELKELGYNVKLINPLISSKYIKSKVRKVKTDKSDAIALAEMGIVMKHQLATFKATKKAVQIKKKVTMLATLQNSVQSMKASVKSGKDAMSTLEIEVNETYSDLEKAIKTMDDAIDQLKQEIVEDMKDNSLVIALSEIKGVSLENASLLMACLIDKDFKTKSQLIAFVGMDISVRESGTYRGRAKLTKRGSNEIRRILGQIAWGLFMHDDKFKKLREHHAGQGRHYFECMVIVARKFLQVLFGMMKSGEAYDPNKVILAFNN